MTKYRHATSGRKANRNSWELKSIPEGDELLCGGGMDADGGVELRLGRAELHRDGQALDDLAGVGADHVRADHALALAVDDQLHKGALLLLAQRELERAEGSLVEVELAVALAGLLFGQADGGEVRIGEHRGRHVL